MSRGAYGATGRRSAPTTFGERLKAVRLAFGWSQADLSKRLGVAQQSVSNWEKDLVPPIGAAQAHLASLLGIKWVALETGLAFRVPDGPPRMTLAEGSAMAIDETNQKPILLPRVEPGEGFVVEASSGESTPLDPGSVLGEIEKALRAGGSVWVVVKRPGAKSKVKKETAGTVPVKPASSRAKKKA